MHRNRTFQEVCRKLGHLSYNKNTGIIGEKKICGHPRQNGNKADASLWYKK
jgi:ribosomal protein L37E